MHHELSGAVSGISVSREPRTAISRECKRATGTMAGCSRPHRRLAPLILVIEPWSFPGVLQLKSFRRRSLVLAIVERMQTVGFA